jgi:hypothetical protein
MLITSYDFGRMAVGGQEYSKDLELYPEGVVPNWRRQDGHLLQSDDLPEIANRKIDYLVIGQGYYGYMQLSDSVKRLLDSLPLEWSAHPSSEAVEEYNRRVELDERVGAVFHLTC